MIDHPTLKLIHVGCVVLSISGFVVRGGLMLMDSSLLNHKLVKTAPHYLDTALLLSGIWLAINLQQYPGTAPWLTAKLIALVIYVVLGSLALRGKNTAIRYPALISALLVVGYMISVAITRSVTPWDIL
mgnify:FL=1